MNRPLSRQTQYLLYGFVRGGCFGSFIGGTGGVILFAILGSRGIVTFLCAYLGVVLVLFVANERSRPTE